MKRHVSHPTTTAPDLKDGPPCDAEAGRWRPRFGAWPEENGIAFRVWAPSAQSVSVVLEAANGQEPGEHGLDREPDGTFTALVGAARVGGLYRYRIDGDALYPDPASRFQPDGVHGPSQIVDPRAFRWSDDGWPGVPLERLVLYELHVGAFTDSGTFDGVIGRLPYLADLGVTAIELMPVADFPGARNWGYDGAALFAPAGAYGAPDNLRRLVDTAHRLGLAVHLDVVYNHLGPDGAYLAAISPQFFTSRHRSPWGDGINLDGPGSRIVRQLLIENALYWVHEFHVDGLRLDATHALADDSERHFLADLAGAVHGAGRNVVVIAEDERNLARIVSSPRAGGWGLDGVWADDFHHEIRRMLAGDHESYYADFSGTADELATAVERGWFYSGQHSVHFGGPRGTDPAGIPLSRFVVCVENHDQVGNRAFGERLNAQAEPAAYRAASTLLLTVPETPLLFMGQEWAASTPFLYFTDHKPDLGALVTEGRRQEFRKFSAFSDPGARESIPDPQDPATFLASKLRWPERGEEPHAGTLRLYRALLALRRNEPLLAHGGVTEVAAVGAVALVVWRGRSDGRGLAIVVRLAGDGEVDLREAAAGGIAAVAGGAGWQVVLTTEDPDFVEDPTPPEITGLDGRPAIRFLRPGAVLLARQGDRRRATL